MKRIYFSFGVRRTLLVILPFLTLFSCSSSDDEPGLIGNTQPIYSLFDKIDYPAVSGETIVFSSHCPSRLVSIVAVDSIDDRYQDVRYNGPVILCDENISWENNSEYDATKFEQQNVSYQWLQIRHLNDTLYEVHITSPQANDFKYIYMRTSVIGSRKTIYTPQPILFTAE